MLSIIVARTIAQAVTIYSYQHYGSLEKNAGADLKRRHLIGDDEIAISSYVDLDARIVYFRDTKNGENHKRPLTDGAYELLIRRKDMTKVNHKNSKWVFPAESKFYKTGPYSDAGSLTSNICDDAKIKKTACMI